MIFNVRPVQTRAIPWGWKNENTAWGPLCVKPRGSIAMPHLSNHFDWDRWSVDVTPSFDDLMPISGLPTLFVSRDMFSVFNTAARFLGWNTLLTEQPDLTPIADGYLSWHKTFLTKCPIELDYAIVGDDVASNLGMMISPGLFRSWLLPHYQRFFRLFDNAGVKVVFHSDGDITEILDDLAGSRLWGLHPCMEVPKLEGRYEYKGLQLLHSIPDFEPKTYAPE